MSRTYVCIDLKTFYASVECVDRGLDPFTTNLVVADPERSQTTICLAISPAMKALGVRNRCRVYEIPEGIDYLMAKPRMRRYMQVSASIYRIYLRYVSREDVHVYSIDECFIDATPYLSLYGTTPKEFAQMLIGAVMRETGICATAGIGENLFLAKVALDITAKHVSDGIGFLDLPSYQRTIWPHRPITDIWNVGPGIARRLATYGVHDMGGVARLDQSLLYREFGVNAEYLIDHAWGLEPCTIADIHRYEPQGSSLGNGQVLPCDYTFSEGRMVLREMADSLVLDLVQKGLVTDSVSLAVGYSRQSSRMPGSKGGGSRKLSRRTNSFKELQGVLDDLYCQTVCEEATIRRINIAFGNLMGEDFATYDLFTDVGALQKERDMQEAVIAVKERFGKNALIKGVSLKDKATARERNRQVGGHHE